MVENWLRTHVADICCREESEVIDSSDFLNELGFDSLDIVELAMEVEDEYGIDVDEADFCVILTFKDAVDYVNAKCAQSTPR